MSDARTTPPSFDEMVGLIKKLFSDYLEDVMKSKPEEIEKSWQRYKTLNRLYQEAASQPPAVKGAVWVNANDQKPKEGKEVFGRDEKGRKWVVFYTYGGKEDIELEDDYDPILYPDVEEINEQLFLREGWYETCEQSGGYCDEINFKRNIVEWWDGESPTAAGDEIDFYFVSQCMMDFARWYKTAKHADLPNDAAEFLADRMKEKGKYLADESEDAAGDGEPRETIENILYATGKFYQEQCTELAEVILKEINGAGDGKEDAVAFMNWTLTSECDTYTCTDEDQWTNIYTKESITTAQLYDIFKNRNNEQK